MLEGITVKEEFPAGFHDAFGRMVMWFGRIEHVLKMIHGSLGPKGFGTAFSEAHTAEEFAGQCRELQALFDSRFADPIQRLALAKVLGKLAPLWAYRDDCVHGCWKPDGDEVLAFRPKRTGGKVEWHSHRTTAAKMAEMAQAVSVVYVALDQLSRLSGLDGKRAAAA